MNMLIEKFIRLKTAVGGNREVTGYEDTFGMPKEAQAHITPPSRWNERILSELEFALDLCSDGCFDSVIEQALDQLLDCMEKHGALPDQACRSAEETLAPLAAQAKTYDVILAAHAHLDMNWMWSYPETVASVLATFRTMLTLMNEYPDYHFSQSQAAVYHMVEEYDPDMMEEIKRRIAEGRWEVTASAWVEADHNMPNTESMLRHIEYTREYLSTHWGVQHFDIDFSPDTFGHNANLPEVDGFAQVRYLYHCRGLKEDHVLYRYRAASGRELLAYREPFWYNAAVTPRMGIAAPKVSRLCAGLRTSLAIYGVGDHGGGPTRRDLERALDMMSWPIFPRMHFGTMRDFFQAAESVRDALPVVNHEVNYFAPGCYTTQSRIKRGNRRMEAALTDAETFAAQANLLTGFRPRMDMLRDAWQNVLFTQFHDILTGSCVQDTREHSMGLYQQSAAVANSRCSLALQSICNAIDTSKIQAQPDPYRSQSEGAGVGYNVESFSGMPCPERGSGLTRVFHVFNQLAQARKAVVEITAWDWLGDLRRVRVTDASGNDIAFQVLDKELQQYWDHKFFRFLAEVDVPSMGYTTVVLTQADAESYPLYFQSGERVSATFDDKVLQNEHLTVVVDALTGRIKSLCVDGNELLEHGKSAGFTFVETECSTSNAWQIGRHIRDLPVDSCVELKQLANGALRQSVKVKYRIASSTIEAVYSLDKSDTLVRMNVTVDWHEIGSETIPVLDYRMPLAYHPMSYQYDIVAGCIRRGAVANDVPALQYGLAVRENAPCAILTSDCKYGYRGDRDTLALTLINSSTSPDPYPERGVQRITLALGGCDADPARAEALATTVSRGMVCQSGSIHQGSLPLEGGLLTIDAENLVCSAITPTEDGWIRVRVYDPDDDDATLRVHSSFAIERAIATDALGKELSDHVTVSGHDAKVTVHAKSLAELRLKLLTRA